jgi:SAM-dependent methyltransferase
MRHDTSLAIVRGLVGNYAELRGGEGRDVFFRPDRVPRSELGAIAVTVEATIGGRAHRGDLVDVSRNGAALVWPAGPTPEVGAIVTELALRFEERDAYRGPARVSSVRGVDGEAIVGVAFTGGLLDVEAVLRLRDVRAWNGGAGAPGLGAQRAPWRVAGHERFKAGVADLRLLLADAREKLTELERALPWSIAHDGGASPARDALVERVRRELAGDVVLLSGELDAALRAASRAEREALRELSMRQLHETLMCAPWMRRAREKPLGYPGDFEVMNYVYRDRFSGPTLFAKALGLSFLCTPAAEAVRTRKDLIKARLAPLLDDRSADRPARILSVASGPAQEIVELLEERRQPRRPVDIVLFDQDRRALAHAHGRLEVAGAERGQRGERVRIAYRHDSVRRLLVSADVLGGEGAFDAVYACGLFDYLQARTAISLCRSLYGLLAPGGTLYVGNMVPSNPCRWFMELHLDWFLVYREAAQLVEIARAAAPGARLELLEEPTGVNPFVALVRDRA